MAERIKMFALIERLRGMNRVNDKLNLFKQNGFYLTLTQFRCKCL